MCDYVRAFQNLDMEVPKLTDSKKLYLFMHNLQPWAQIELRRQNVQTLSQAIAAVDRLLDYKGNLTKGYGGTKNDAGKKRKAF